MKIRHFLYNAFLVEDEGVKIAIDPGQYLWLFKLGSLIPKQEWPNITHVLVTHGDPDHYWHADRVAKAANAPLVCSRSMVKQLGKYTRILIPRRSALKFVPYPGQVLPLDVGTVVDTGKVRIEGIKTTHGPVEYSFFGIKQRRIPGPKERAGFGSIGFYIHVNGASLVNVGDSIFQEEWAGLQPDVLMLPIGGPGNKIWTMDVNEAVEAVRLIAPRLVIPCHYNVPFLWKKIMCPADDNKFKRLVEKMGIECRIMQYGDMVEVKHEQQTQPLKSRAGL